MSIAVAYYDGPKIYYLTPFVTDVSWSGETTQASRNLQISLNDTLNGTTKAFDVKLGKDVRFYVNGAEVFRGVIFQTQIDSKGALQFTAHDYNHYLTKNSDSQKFSGKKASDIVRYICAQYQIPAGQIDDTGYVFPKLILRDKTIYDMITIALTETRKKTGRVFILGNEGGKLTLRERKNQVKRLIIADGSNLLSADYSQSIEDLRNSVRFTGKSGEDAKGVTVSNSDSIKQYGLMREKQHDGDKTDAQLKPVATALLAELNKVTTESNVEAIGDASVIAGKLVQISERMTGIAGGFYVISDSHKFSPNGTHTMTLKVSKTLELNEIEYEPPEEAMASTSKSSGDLDSENTPTGDKPKDSGATLMTPASGSISSGYGMRSGKMHYGIDIAAKGVVPIVAAADGSVTRSYRSSTYGECIILRHTINGKTYETLYAHMRSGSRKVKTGGYVKRGQIIGYMGNTGDSSGQHLHFEVHSPTWNTNKSNAVNPQNYL
jgi:murein DD-endopeptidase MepM/ murein hydrolase activator NlpD